MSGLDFYGEDDHQLIHSNGQSRAATAEECALWNALQDRLPSADRVKAFLLADLALVDLDAPPDHTCHCGQHAPLVSTLLERIHELQ